MKRITAIALVAFSALITSQAHAVGTPAIDVVGEWGTEQGCVEGTFNYVRDNGTVFQVIDDNGKIYKSALRISIEGNMLHLIDDEKKFSYRIVADDRIEFLGFTNLDNGLSARIKPRMWHRCS